MSSFTEFWDLLQGARGTQCNVFRACVPNFCSVQSKYFFRTLPLMYRPKGNKPSYSSEMPESHLVSLKANI